MADDILSQTAVGPLPDTDNSVRPYNPVAQQRVVRERLYGLEGINEHFARQFRMGYLARCAFRQISRPVR